MPVNPPFWPIFRAPCYEMFCPSYKWKNFEMCTITEKESFILKYLFFSGWEIVSFLDTLYDRVYPINWTNYYFFSNTESLNFEAMRSILFRGVGDTDGNYNKKNFNLPIKMSVIEDITLWSYHWLKLHICIGESINMLHLLYVYWLNQKCVFCRQIIKKNNDIKSSIFYDITSMKLGI